MYDAADGAFAPVPFGMTASMADSKKTTLRDVAQAAGVSTGTVSMVLNGNPLVAELTRSRVREVIERLGYVYDRRAAQLRSRRTGIVGASICNLANPYFAEFTVGLEETLARSGLALILGHCGESPEQQTRFLNTAREYNVEGLVLMPVIGTTRRMVEMIADWGIPLITVTRHVTGSPGDYAGSDNRRAGRLATRHLIDLGHRRIAFAGANALTSTGRDRLTGYRQALAGADIPVEPELIQACAASREAGFLAARELLGLRKPPSAICCFNDLIAFGVMLGIRSLGFEPGVDCSVVGMDDVAEAALWQPGLTTVALHSRRIGTCAGELLQKRLAEPDRPVEKILLAPELVVRGSSGPVRGAFRSR